MDFYDLDACEIYTNDRENRIGTSQKEDFVSEIETFSLNIELGNETMQTPDDVAEALLRVIARLQDGHKEGAIRDLNGNTVGTFALASFPLDES